MKIEISNPNASTQDILEICQFLREKWKTRADTLFIKVLEGTDDLTVEELERFVREVFNNELNDENILVIKKKKVR